MIIRPTEINFYILPLFQVTKFKNTLTKEAKETFNYNWKDYYQITIGWLWWNKTFNI